VAEPGEKPTLRARVEVVVGNAIPVVGVAALGWNAFQVVTLYVLDGWFCILGLGASVMLAGSDELRRLVPARYGPLRRTLYWVVTVTVVEAILSLFALIPGVAVLQHMTNDPVVALRQGFSGPAGWLPVIMLIVSHALRVARGTREPDAPKQGVMALDPKAQMSFFAGRMALMMSLAGLAQLGSISHLLVPVYVAAVAVLFTYTDLYPRHFLAKLTAAQPGDPDPPGDTTSQHGATGRS